jgi:hypothetical protein
MQASCFRVERPGNVDALRGHRQRAEFRRVGAEFIECHRNRDHGAGCHSDFGSIYRKLRRVRIVEGFSRAADNLSEVGTGPNEPAKGNFCSGSVL